MKILLCSYSFTPSLGGIETISVILAREFVRAGANVTVVTLTPGNDVPDEYVVVRNPKALKLWSLINEADIIFQNNISLNLLLPALLTRKPVFVTHQTWLTRTDGSIGWQDRVKRFLLQRCANVSISNAIAKSLPVSSTVIFNPYEASEFLLSRSTSKDRDLIFMGRLVSDKGCDLLLRALASLKESGMTPNLTIVGDGEERPKLLALSKSLGIENQVVFLGALREGRSREVARHRIMVVPSKWAEPFGIVALEGIAAGCVIIASEGGGLPDAVGSCGLFYPNGDLDRLTDCIASLLTKPELMNSLVQNGPSHLERFSPDVVAKRYLDLFQEARKLQ